MSKSQHLLRREQGTGQFLRFAVVGVGNTLIDFAALNLLLWTFQFTTGLGLILCNAGGFVCANLNSFIFNKFWTFNDPQKISVNQYSTFLWVSLVGLGLNSLFLWLLGDLFAPNHLRGTFLWVNFSKVVATGANLVWNFLAYKKIVFKGDREVGR